MSPVRVHALLNRSGKTKTLIVLTLSMLMMGHGGLTRPATDSNTITTTLQEYQISISALSKQNKEVELCARLRYPKM